MSAHLIIHDGALPQWWLSPDIWVVPGNDPNGPPGSPIAGKPAYVWARVSNTGDSFAEGTRVDFYWANPSAQMVVGVATAIGSAYVDLAPGDTQEVLCLVPWIPVVVNGGHECVLAVAHAPGDSNPLPDPLPNGFPFDPPSHEQIAQLNLSVLEAGMLQVSQLITVMALAREDKTAELSVSMGHALDRRTAAQLGLAGLHPAEGGKVHVSLSREPRCSEHHDQEAQHTLRLEVPRGASAPVYVNISAHHLEQQEYQLVHVTEHASGKLVGGVSYVIVNRLSKQEQAS